MAPISNHVSLTISQDSLGVARAGFGVPMILSATAAFAERIRFYSSLAEVAEDFASTTGPEYLAAQALFSQSPHPEQIAIGRSALPPTQKYEIAVAAVRNSHTYEIVVKGDGITTETADYASDAGATQQEIANGLLTALNAVVGKNYTATFPALVFADITFQGEADDDTLTFGAAHGLETGDGPVRVSGAGLPTGLSAGTDYYVVKVSATVIKLATSLTNALAGTIIDLTTDGSAAQTLSDHTTTVSPYDGIVVTADAAGDWFSLEVNPNDLSNAQTHVDPGIATDLAAIALENNNWYCLLTLYNSNAYVLAAAAWVESNSKIYVWDGCDTAFITGTDGNSDTIDDLQGLSRARTMSAYHPSPADMMAAAWAGRCLPIEPGGESWKFKTLSGVSAVSMTSTHRTNLTAKNGNSYETVASVNVTFDGKTSDGDFLDIQRGLDWLDDDMRASVFEDLARNDKVPFTDPGIGVIEAAVRGSLRRAVAKGILAEDPAPVVTVPLVASISQANKALRLLPDVRFSGTLAGAIHKVTITGVVSV